MDTLPPTLLDISRLQETIYMSVQGAHGRANDQTRGVIRDQGHTFIHSFYFFYQT